MAPHPYLSLAFPQTIVIEPWGVLIAMKNSNFYIRAHAELFINELSKKCNIIYWTDLMPIDADKLLSQLPKKPNIHMLYKYHCKHVKI